MSLLQMPLRKLKHSSDHTFVTNCLLRSTTSVNPSKHILRSQVSTQPRLRAHHRKNRTAKRIGFQTPSDTTNNPLHPIVLSKLSTPYPIPKAYVLERSEPIPDPPKVTDHHRGKCDLLIPIDESKLQYTLPATQGWNR